MKKTKREARLPMTSDVRSSVATIITSLDQAQMTTSFSSFELFNRALVMYHAVLHGASFNQWINEICDGLERAMIPLSVALSELVMQATVNYQDILGLVYMQLRFGDHRKGQYFSPFVVARAMAEILLSDLSRRAPGEAPLVIGDICCGSGIMLLAAMEVIERQHPERLDDGSVRFYGMDIDPTCIRLAQLNLDLHRLGRAIRSGILFDDPAFLTALSALANQHGGSLLYPGGLPVPRAEQELFRIREAAALSTDERRAVERAAGRPLPTQGEYSAGEVDLSPQDRLFTTYDPLLSQSRVGESPAFPSASPSAEADQFTENAHPGPTRGN